jgi:hypothetical protein
MAGHQGLDAEPAALLLDQRDLGVAVGITYPNFCRASSAPRPRA